MIIRVLSIVQLFPQYLGDLMSTDGKKLSNDGAQQETYQSTPLSKLRNDYLWVSDLAQQIWCEQQLVYKLTLPTVLVEEPAMTEGSNLHLARGMLAQERFNRSGIV